MTLRAIGSGVESPNLYRILWCVFGTHANDAKGPHESHPPHLHHAGDHYGEIVLCPGGDYSGTSVYVRDESPDSYRVGYIGGAA